GCIAQQHRELAFNRRMQSPRDELTSQVGKIRVFEYPAEAFPHQPGVIAGPRSVGRGKKRNIAIGLMAYGLFERAAIRIPADENPVSPTRGDALQNSLAKLAHGRMQLVRLFGNDELSGRKNEGRASLRIFQADKVVVTNLTLNKLTIFKLSY